MKIDYKKYVTAIENFPIEGVTFRDITSFIQNGEAFKNAIEEFSDFAKKKKADIIVGPESRGFMFGCPVAFNLGIGFVPVRKPGKLPREVISFDYDLEYGKNTLEMHRDAIKKGQKVIIIDDLLATGGTTLATIKLVEELGGEVVGICYLIELKEEFNSRKKLEGYDVFTLIEY